MKWERVYDSEVFDEETIDSAVEESMDSDDLQEAMYDTMHEIGFSRFFESLSLFFSNFSFYIFFLAMIMVT